MQCLGRLVRDAPKGTWMLPFEGETAWFHLPIRCDRISVVNGLCTGCYEKGVRTKKKEEEMQGRTIKAMHPALLHGCIGEAVPPWSHIVGGEWFNLKLRAGYTVSEEVMARAKKAIAAAEGDGAAAVAAVKGVAVTATRSVTPARRGRKPKNEASTVVADTPPPPPPMTIKQHLERAAILAEATPQPQPQPQQLSPPPSTPAATPTSTSTPKKRGPAPKAKSAAAPPLQQPLMAAVGYVEDPRASSVEDIVEIAVRHLELEGGFSYYLDPKKQKVYDLEFKYVGRFNATKRQIHRGIPDSDAEED